MSYDNDEALRRALELSVEDMKNKPHIISNNEQTSDI